MVGYLHVFWEYLLVHEKEKTLLKYKTAKQERAKEKRKDRKEEGRKEGKDYRKEETNKPNQSPFISIEHSGLALSSFRKSFSNYQNGMLIPPRQPNTENNRTGVI